LPEPERGPETIGAPPLTSTLASRVVPAARSRTKMSLAPLVSFGAKLLAALAKAIRRPFEDMEM
jgi:hypothetical protein